MSIRAVKSYKVLIALVLCCVFLFSGCEDISDNSEGDFVSEHTNDGVSQPGGDSDDLQEDSDSDSESDTSTWEDIVSKEPIAPDESSSSDDSLSQTDPTPEDSEGPTEPIIHKNQNISLNKSYTVNFLAEDKYPDRTYKLTDGKHAETGSYTDKDYGGWIGNDPIITLDLGKNYDKIKAFEVGYLCTDEAGILPPEYIKVEVSQNSKTWSEVGTLTKPAVEMKTPQVAILETEKYAKGRYVRFTVKAAGRWVFLDEITVIADVTLGTASISKVTLERQYNQWLAHDILFTVDNTTGTITEEASYIIPRDKELFFTIIHNGDKITDGNKELNQKVGFIARNSDTLIVVAKDGSQTPYVLDLTVEGYGLPVVLLTTKEGAGVSKTSDYTVGQATFLTPEGNNMYNLPMQIRVRGNSTRSHPKLAYRVKLDKKQNVLNMGSAKNWVLLANHSDKSLLRNTAAFNLASMFKNLGFTPRAKSVEVYLNGSYIGVYTLGDHIQVNSIRVNIEEDSKEDDTGYFMEWDVRAAEEDRRYFEVAGVPISILSPKPVTDSQYEYIVNYVKNVNSLLYLKSEKVWDYLDMASCIDWLLAKEICGATGLGYDAYMYKDRGGKLKFGPVWDYDLAFGNADFGGADRYDRFYLCGGQWMASWLKYESFRREFFKVWEVAKKTYIPQMIKDLWADYEYQKHAAEHNFQRWDILGTYVWPNPSDVMAANTYKKQIEQVESYIINHTRWMDEEFQRNYGYVPTK